MKFKAIIFDMDGTIIDTGSIWQEATRKVIDHKLSNLSESEKNVILESFHGMSLYDTCSYLKRTFNLSDSIEQLIQEKLDHANILFDRHIAFINGFEQFHKLVKKNNLKYGVATNAVDDTIERTKQALQLHTYFGDHIYGISQVHFKSKPDPAIFLYTAEKLGVTPEECIVIEDSSHGVTAAQAAGMYCIGINTARKLEQIEHAHETVEEYNQIDLKRLLSPNYKKNYPL
jgi:beta-phosphoglucomutase